MSEEKLKPVFMFIWKYLFTFMSIGYLIYVLVSARGAPHPDTYSFFVWVFIWAIAFDLGKTKTKVGTGLHSRFEGIKPHDRDPFTQRTTARNVHNDSPYSDRFIPGTTAWSVHSYSRDWDRFTPGTSAWNSRQ